MASVDQCQLSSSSYSSDEEDSDNDQDSISEDEVHDDHTSRKQNNFDDFNSFPLKRTKDFNSEDEEHQGHHSRKRKNIENLASSPTKRTKGGAEASMEDMQKLGNYSSISSKLMAKMGYKSGTGLGKEKQGRVNIVPMSTQRGRRGLGLQIKTLTEGEIVDWKNEKPPSAEEEVEWIPPYNQPIPPLDELEEWEQIRKKKLVIEDEDVFCDVEILKTMLSCKSVFDELEGHEMRNARMRSNPYETIRGVIFLNRAAMKMANMDACCDFMFTKPKNLLPNEPLYFADICAGPGGFSEYILWRKKWKSKGFGFTLKGDNDFKLDTFYAAHPEFFETHYGVGGKEGDGDIMKSDNIEEFQHFVLDSTDDKGVHFVMADGGFSVEGQENIQEILTKQLLLCQFACALSIVREEGHFLCKTFDLFTPFSIGLIYLLRMAFRRVSLFKPVTSRPANSERYVICEGYRDPERVVYQYLMGVNDTLNELATNDKGRDVREVVPLEMILEDTAFFQYVKSSNERIATEQSRALSKIHSFAKDRSLTEASQGKIREACLKRWGIPDQVRVAPPRTDVATLFHRLTSLVDPSSWLGSEPARLDQESMHKLERVYDYRCFTSAARSSILISMGGARVYRWIERTKRWNNLTEVRCSLPRDTIIEVEIVSELKGEGKGQHRVQALHIVDVMVLAGENVMMKNYNERLQCANMFAKAISQPTCSYLTIVRTKHVYRLEEVEQIFHGLSLKRVKGGGVNERVCSDIAGTKLSYVPSGLTFVKFMKDPWSMAFSKSSRRKYFYNCQTKKSVYECPPDASASYESSAQSRIFWKWEENVKIHPSQSHRRADLVSSDQLIEFVDRSIHR